MFYYIEKFQIQSDSVKSVIINQSIHNLDELFECFRTTLQFPYTTVTNWNAFRDVMRELEWIPENEIRIYHETLPSFDKQTFARYIDILNLIDVEWEKDEERADIVRKHMEKTGQFIPSDIWINGKSKIFNVFFHQKDESFVKKILRKYSHNYRKCLYYDEKGIEHIKYANYGTWVTDKIYGQ